MVEHPLRVEEHFDRGAVTTELSYHQLQPFSGPPTATGRLVPMFKFVRVLIPISGCFVGVVNK